MFGCGPVGQFAIASCRLLGAGRIFAIDHVESRLRMAASQGAETIDFHQEDPVTTILRLTGGIGVDRLIDAVGVDAQEPSGGPALKDVSANEHKKGVEEIAPNAKPKDGNWKPGSGPSQALEWAAKAIAKGGAWSIVGVYPQTMKWSRWERR